MNRVRFLRDVRAFGGDRICCFSGRFHHIERRFVRGESYDIDAYAHESAAPVLRLMVSDGTMHMPFVEVPWDAVVIDDFPVTCDKPVLASMQTYHDHALRVRCERRLNTDEAGGT